MTAEIAILNRQGVALAADSAVSIGTKKVYNSANKLFALSKKHPVGIMIYGNAQLSGVPWETIIKYYRANHLKSRSFDRLVDYADDFLDFLQGTELLTPESERYFVRSHCHQIATRIRDNILNNVDKALHKSGPINDSETKRIANEEFKNFKNGVAKNKTHESFTKEISSRIKKKYAGDIKEAIADVLEKIPFSPQQLRAITDAMIATIGTLKTWDGVSGVVIAGYGEKDIFPVVSELSIEGRVEGFVKVVRGEGMKIELENNAAISPFAQREMVDTFMRGIDPSLFREIHQSLKLILHKMPDMLKTDHGVNFDAIKMEDINKTMDNLINNFTDHLVDMQDHYFVRPILQSVGALPLDELAAMAEALVNLTSFKRKVTMVPESVGGPIDVAVISKGDGFIWIKRKHYFAPELNPDFFERIKERS